MAIDGCLSAAVSRATILRPRGLPLTDQIALQPVPLDDDSARLQALEAELEVRERELDAFKIDLQQLQARYLTEIGGLYAELSTIEADLTEAEIRAGLRPPLEELETADEDPTPGAADDESCGAHAAPSDMLKRVFRDLAKTIHPDLAMDDAARFRRHSLMAEANRAYADRDADRLLLILRRWHRSPESVVGDDAESRSMRARRKIVEIEERLAAIDAESVELRNSAIARLKLKIDETRRQGWDLFAEMVMQVRTDIGRARARLIGVQRMVGVRTEGRTPT